MICILLFRVEVANLEVFWALFMNICEELLLIHMFRVLGFELHSIWFQLIDIQTFFWRWYFLRFFLWDFDQDFKFSLSFLRRTHWILRRQD